MQCTLGFIIILTVRIITHCSEVHHFEGKSGFAISRGTFALQLIYFSLHSYNDKCVAL